MDFKIAGYQSHNGVLYRTVGTCEETRKQRWIKHSDDSVGGTINLAHLSELLENGSKLTITPFSDNSVILSKREWELWKSYYYAPLRLGQAYYEVWANGSDKERIEWEETNLFPLPLKVRAKVQQERFRIAKSPKYREISQSIYHAYIKNKK